MNSKNFGYSLKNIPIPDKKSYTLSLMEKVESFIKKIRWKAHFFLQNDPSTENGTKTDDSLQDYSKNNFGFKTKNTPKPIAELAKFEEELFDIVKNLEFKRTKSDFQDKLKADLAETKSSPNVLVFADKTTNMYELDKGEHDKLLLENVTKTYKKAPQLLEKSINLEAKEIAKKLDIDKRVECLAKTGAFITLKDHEENFQNKKPCRLIVPSKSEVGHISKAFLDRINQDIRGKLQLNQWKNTMDVINWFKNIEQKQMKNLAVLLFLTSLCSAETTTKRYCRPHQDCWPPQADWDDLKTKVDGGLNKLDKDVYEECYAQKDNAYGIEKAANGVCMQYHDCSKEFCVKGMKWNLPEYSVTAKTVEHVQEALKFANKFNIEVRIKTSGHSYAGSSTGKDTLLIWMYHFKKYDTIGSFENSCGTKYNKTIKVGGGETWHDVYGAITDKYNIVGGGGLSVSAAGGWLQGVGLSALSRYHGAGIDNVLWFEVVLADGTLVTADACENTDLFWALRGGGGGTFGVVTAVYYKLHPVQKVTSATMEIKNLLTTGETADGWLEKWVELSLKLDRRWGGYWTLNGYILYFVGNQTEAEATFLNKIYEWKNSLPKEQADSVVMGVAETNSYYRSRGGIDSGTDKTGQMEFNIYDRLVPRRWVEEDKARAVDMLKWMLRNGFYTFNYVLGGAMEDVGAEDTAVNPYMRKAIWQIEVFEERMIKKLRESVRDSGVGYNHAFKLEPDWENQFWGTNLARLQQLKKKFDPENRLNCWHCIGYVKQEDQSTGSAALQKHSIFVVLLFSAVTNYFTFA